MSPLEPKSLIDRLPIGLFVFEVSSGKILTINQKALDLLGHTLNDQNQNVHDILPYFICFDGTPYPPGNSPVSKVLLTNQESSCDDIIIKHPQKEPIYVFMSATPVEKESKKIVNVVVTLQEITSLKRSEKMKLNYLSMISHDLRTPLTTILSMASALTDKTMTFTSEERENIAKKIEKSARRSSIMIEDFLTVSRSEMGKIPISKSHFSLEGLLREVIEYCQYFFKNHQFELHAGPDINHINADEFKIYQVLINILGNAAKYSSENQPIIIHLKKESGFVRVSIKDSGPGIPKEEWENVFKRFYRVENEVNKRFSGYGLGLTICKDIIDAHNGKIWIESEVGQGSQFIFTIPSAE